MQAVSVNEKCRIPNVVGESFQNSRLRHCSPGAVRSAMASWGARFGIYSESISSRRLTPRPAYWKRSVDARHAPDAVG